MLVNELFDTVVFLCSIFIGASILMALIYFVCNNILGIDLDWH
jgi:hypothetical protein